MEISYRENSTFYLQNLPPDILDFPVFCCDGIFWTNKVIVLALAPFLKESLEEDSSLILPDLRVSQFKLFHENLFIKRNLSTSDCSVISYVGQLFGLEKYSLSDSLNCDPLTLDYQRIFRAQREEYFNKIYGNLELSSHVLRLSKEQKKPVVSEYLNDILHSEETSPSVVECEDCGRTFDDPSLLSSHRATVHSSRPGLQPKTFPCRFCGKTFAYSVNERRHTYLVHPRGSRRDLRPQDLSYQLDSEGLVINSSQLDQKSNKSQETFPKLDQFRCNICGEFLKSKRYLVAHIQTHYGGGYKCDYPGCQRVFKENAKLKRHKLVHTGEKAFKCEYCGLSFSLRHNLKTHEKTHARRDLLKCRYCRYETIQKCNLRLHELTHERTAAGTRSGKGRPHGKQSRKIIEAVELLEKEESFETEEDQIEEFMKEMESDDTLQ